MAKNKYSNKNIVSIKTGLGGNFEYSPSFRNFRVKAEILLTGYRAKDYKSAESKSNIMHTPRKNVWHHVWNVESTNVATLELVDYSIHKKTYPHAGACKKWSLENNRKYRYMVDHDQNYSFQTGYVYKRVFNMSLSISDNSTIRVYGPNNYTDFVIDFIFTDSDKKFIQDGINSLKSTCPERLREEELIPYALDPYGNFFYYGSNKRLFFFDHEMCEVFELRYLN